VKRILAILFLTFLTTASFAKGSSGICYIRGIAYGTDKTILKNADLTIKIGNATKTVKTNSNGEFEIDVYWESACPSGRTLWQHRRDDKKINPEFIFISYADKEIKLNNKWKKYAESFPDSIDQVTWKKDLFFG
jgi:hypothetical protein